MYISNIYTCSRSRLQTSSNIVQIQIPVNMWNGLVLGGLGNIYIYTYIYIYIYIHIYIYIFWIYCIDLYSVNTLNNNTHTYIYMPLVSLALYLPFIIWSHSNSPPACRFSQSFARCMRSQWSPKKLQSEETANFFCDQLGWCQQRSCGNSYGYFF
jgi:hypothetical protein